MSAADKLRILAVDFGDRRTGLAATDPTGTIVVPLAALVTQTAAECARAVAALAREREAEIVVVGVPLDAKGQAGQRARRTLAFVELLRPLAPCAVTTVDESETTNLAHELLKEAGLKAARRKQLADSVAAMQILERYRQRPQRPG